MDNIFTAAFPVFSVILIGLVIGRINLLGPHAPLVINKFVFYITLPCLLFFITSQAAPADLLNIDFIALFTLGTIGSILFSICSLYYFKHDNLKEDLIFIMNGILGNTAYMGIPILLALLGPKGAVAAAMGTIMVNATFSALAIIILNYIDNKKEGINPKDIFKIFSTPFISATIVGIFCSLLQIKIPLPFINFTELLGSPTTACALFGVGLTLAKLKPKKKTITEASVITIIKLVISPLIVIALAPLFPNIDPIWKTSVIILAATPVAVTNYIIACENDCFAEETATAVFLSTIGSVITLVLCIRFFTG